MSSKRIYLSGAPSEFKGYRNELFLALTRRGFEVEQSQPDAIGETDMVICLVGSQAGPAESECLQAKELGKPVHIFCPTANAACITPGAISADIASFRESVAGSAGTFKDHAELKEKVLAAVAATPASEASAPAAPVAEPAPTPASGDDLTLLEGVDESKAATLLKAGISQFDQLENLDEDERGELATRLGWFDINWGAWAAVAADKRESAFLNRDKSVSAPIESKAGKVELPLEGDSVAIPEIPDLAPEPEPVPEPEVEAAPQAVAEPTPPQPSQPVEPPAKKPGFFARLFGKG